MKITLFLPGLGNGGAERVFINLYKYLLKEQIQVELVCSTCKGALKNNVNIKVIYLGSSYGYMSFYKYHRYLNKRKPDVVIATLSSSIIIAALTKYVFRKQSYKLICRIANIYQKPSSIFGALKIFLHKKAIDIADGIIANSLATMASISEILDANMEGKLTRIISNPVLEDEFLEKRRLINLNKTIKDQNHKIIVLIGRLVPQKRIDHAIKAFSLIQNKVRSCKLVIVGDGPEKDSINNLIKKYEVTESVVLVDYCDNIPKLLSESDCMISTSKYEGFGNVLIEGVTYCDNVISYKSKGGASEILPPTKAILVEDGNIIKLSESILEALTNVSSRKLASDDYLSNFTLSKVGYEYLRFLKKVVNE